MDVAVPRMLGSCPSILACCQTSVKHSSCASSPLGLYTNRGESFSTGVTNLPPMGGMKPVDLVLQYPEESPSRRNVLIPRLKE